MLVLVRASLPLFRQLLLQIQERCGVIAFRAPHSHGVCTAAEFQRTTGSPPTTGARLGGRCLEADSQVFVENSGKEYLGVTSIKYSLHWLRGWRTRYDQGEFSEDHFEGVNSTSMFVSRSVHSTETAKIWNHLELPEDIGTSDPQDRPNATSVFIHERALDA